MRQVEWVSRWLLSQLHGEPEWRDVLALLAKRAAWQGMQASWSLATCQRRLRCYALSSALSSPPIAAFARLLEAVKDVVANTGCGSDVDEACSAGECGHIDQTEELLDAIARLKEAARAAGIGGPNG